MKSAVSRGRLMAGAALGFGLAMIAAQPAQAACNNVTVTNTLDTISCVSNTTTTDTTYPANVPNDRHYSGTAAFPLFGEVLTGVLVDGYGLAFTGNAPSFTVTNNGIVQVNAGLSPTAGGGAALNITGNGATNINYLGTGSISNLGAGTSANGLVMTTTGTGNITAVVGGNVRASGDSSLGIAALNVGTAGNISITTLAGNTILAGQTGILASNDGSGSTTVINGAAIGSAPGTTIDSGIQAVSGVGTGGISVTNTGAIGSATDILTNFGIQAALGNVANASAISVTGTGAIFSVATGIDVDTNGTGNVTVNYTGAVNVSGLSSDGIRAEATTGTLSVTSGAITTTGANGILAETTTGNQIITNSGAVTANEVGILTLSTSGNQVINVNGTVTSTGANDAIRATADTGTIQVNVTRAVTGSNDALELTSSGTKTVTVSATGSLVAPLDAINSIGTGALNLNNSGIVSGIIRQQGVAPVTVNNLAGATMTTNFLLDGGADTFNNNGIWNTQGTSDFGAGVDVVNNLGSGTINILGNTTLTNLETLTNSGRINLNTFTLTGTGIAFTNAGTIDTNGNAGLLGFSSFSNAGTLDLAAGTFTVPAGVFTNTGTILADEGTSTIIGQSSLANSGTIDLSDGVANDILTVLSNFAGSGASTLAVDYDGIAADKLIIAGTASGSTAVDVNYLGGFNPDGVLVVDAISSTPDAFILGDLTGSNPLVDISLIQSGSDFYLASAPNEATFAPLSVNTLVLGLWYQSADEVIANLRIPTLYEGLGFWGQVYGSIDKTGQNDHQTIEGVTFGADDKLETDRYGFQGGIDYGFGIGRAGLTVGYGHADANRDNGGDLKAKGWNVGLYGQYGGLVGFHGEAFVKYDDYNVDFDSGVFDGFSPDAQSTGVDGAVGYRFPIGGNIVLDTNAGISHVWTKIDDIDAYGFDYDYDKLTSTRGRIGVRANFPGAWVPYLDGTVYHEFDGDGQVAMFDGGTIYDLETSGHGTWVRFEAGIGGTMSHGPMFALWADAGDRTGVGIRGGFRFGGRAEEPVEIAPPPPPPPPPPATQTCPDGSVILATDTCPPPPPPPPPPPEPERG